MSKKAWIILGAVVLVIIIIVAVSAKKSTTVVVTQPQPASNPIIDLINQVKSIFK